MNVYLLKLRHDNGIIGLYVFAISEEKAKYIAMESELCPECAIFSIRKLKSFKIV